MSSIARGSVLAIAVLGAIAIGIYAGSSAPVFDSSPSIAVIVACNVAAGRPGWDAAREHAYVARQAAALNMSERGFRAIDYYDTCYGTHNSRSGDSTAPLRRDGSER